MAKGFGGSGFSAEVVIWDFAVIVTACGFKVSGSSSRRARRALPIVLSFIVQIMGPVTSPVFVKPASPTKLLGSK